MKANAAVVSGVQGEHTYWEYDSDTKTLAISGNGEMEASWEGEEYHCDWWVYKNVAETIVVEDGMTTIADLAFWDFVNVKDVILSDYIKTIGNAAFLNCGITEIDWPADLETVVEGAFSNTNIQLLDIPGRIKEIPRACFGGCNSFNTVKINEGINVIGEGAFDWNQMLVNVEICEGVLEIQKYAFTNCENLKSIILPQSVVTIEPEAFDSDIFIYCNNSIQVEYCELFDIAHIDLTQDYVLEDDTVSLAVDSFVYSNDEIIPEIKYMDIILHEGVHYTAVYNPYPNVGTASVTITGIGNFSGTVTKEYIVEPRTMEDVKMKQFVNGVLMEGIDFNSCLFDGTEKKVTYELYDGNYKLVEGKDYYLHYGRTTNNKFDLLAGCNFMCGSNVIEIHGMGNYTGLVSTLFTVREPILNECTVTVMPTVLYDGKTLKPQVIITYGGYTFTEGKGYTVEWTDENMGIPGMKKFQIIGTRYTYIPGETPYGFFYGSGEYEVEVSAEEIALAYPDKAGKTKSIEEANITLKNMIYTYDGSKKNPSVTVRLDGKKLKKNVDYTVIYTDNIDDGTAYAIVSGINNYWGTVKISYVILPYSAGMDAVYEDGTLIDGKFVYGITDDEDLEVELCCPAVRNLSDIKIPATITDENGVKYKVTSI